MTYVCDMLVQLQKRAMRLNKPLATNFISMAILELRSETIPHIMASV